MYAQPPMGSYSQSPRYTTGYPMAQPMMAAPMGGSFIAAPVQMAPYVAQAPAPTAAEEEPAKPVSGKDEKGSKTETYDTIDLEEAIDMVGVGTSTYVVYIIVGLFTAADSVEVAFISYVTTWLEKPWHLTESDKALMESMVFAGQIIGAPIWGMLADKKGRRPVFLVSAALITTFGYLTALAPDKTVLTCIRFVVGFGVAGLSVPFDIFAEMLPSQARGKYLMATFFWFAIGSFYTTFAAWLTLEQYGWQVFTCMAALPTTIATIAGIFLLPESAHWLASEHRQEEAAETMNTVAKRNGSKYRFKKCTVPPVLENLGTKDLLTHSKLRKPFFSMALVWLGFGVAFYGISLLMPHMFHDEGGGIDDGNCTAQFNSTLREKLLPAKFTYRPLTTRDIATNGTKIECEDEPQVSFDFQALLLPNFGQAFGLLCGLLLIDTAGRKLVQQVSYGLSALFTIFLGFPSLGQGTLSVMSSLALMAQMSASCCTWTHTPELFPTKVRGVANAILNSFARLGAFLSPFIISDAIFHDAFTRAAIMAGFSLLGAIAVSFVKETSGSTHLDDEDVESSFEEGEEEASESEN